jgi:manganese/iron transport system ATP-binding protein
MLKVQDLAVNYRGINAVDNINFCLNLGQLVGIIGPNGAGKSTLIKAMLGLIPIERGVVTFRSRPLKRQLGTVAYVPQRCQIDWDYPVTVWNVVMMARTLHLGWARFPSRQSREWVAAALQRVGIWELRHRQIGELSGGQQQRVFLARALAQQADLFCFDEPLVGVDQQTEAVIFDVFAELKAAGKTLLVISHDLGNRIAAYDHFLLLNRQLIAEGGRDKVITAHNLDQAYGNRRSLLECYRQEEGVKC